MVDINALCKKIVQGLVEVVWLSIKIDKWSDLVLYDKTLKREPMRFLALSLSLNCNFALRKWLKS